MFKLGINKFLFCGDFNAFHSAWGSSNTSRRGNMIHDVISLKSLSILNTGLATHLGRLNCPKSAMDNSFSSSNLIWLATWYTLTNPHGSNHFPIIFSLNSSSRNCQNIPNSAILNTSNSSFLHLCNLTLSYNECIVYVIRQVQWLRQHLYLTNLPRLYKNEYITRTTVHSDGYGRTTLGQSSVRPR